MTRYKSFYALLHRPVRRRRMSGNEGRPGSKNKKNDIPKDRQSSKDRCWKCSERFILFDRLLPLVLLRQHLLICSIRVTSSARKLHVLRLLEVMANITLQFRLCLKLPIPSTRDPPRHLSGYIILPQLTILCQHLHSITPLCLLRRRHHHLL